jgi:hypothetical protein
MPIDGSRVRTNAQDGFGVQGILRLTYDFAVHGGAIATIPLGVSRDGLSAASFTLPKGAVIYDGYFDVLTLFTSGGAAQIALTSGEGAGDLLAAAILGTNGTTGRHALVPTSVATSVKTTTATRVPAIVVSAATLTAGKGILVVRYAVTG